MAWFQHRIRTASEQLGLGLISIWQFLQQCSHASAAYVQRKRNWNINNPEDVEEQDLEEPQIRVPHRPIDNMPIQGREVDRLLNVNDPPDAWNSTVCMVCMIATVENSATQYMVLPCRHAWVCHNCVFQLTGPNTSCPVCRTQPVSFKRIFFS